MPAILCIETTSAVCSAALTHNGQIFYSESTRPQAHAEVLSGLLQDCLQKGGLTFKDLKAVAISEGPGSYTGLRIGTSTAKGLCFALGIPLINIGTLKIIASVTREQCQGKLLWAMIDARRMEVYHCVFDEHLNALTKVDNGIITDMGFVPEMVDQNTVLCGDGAAKAAPILNLEYIEGQANASALCGLAVEAFHDKRFADLASFEPFYLKQANITAAKSK